MKVFNFDLSLNINYPNFGSFIQQIIIKRIQFTIIHRFITSYAQSIEFLIYFLCCGQERKRIQMSNQRNLFVSEHRLILQISLHPLLQSFCPWHSRFKRIVLNSEPVFFNQLFHNLIVIFRIGVKLTKNCKLTSTIRNHVDLPLFWLITDEKQRKIEVNAILLIFLTREFLPKRIWIDSDIILSQ